MTDTVWQSLIALVYGYASAIVPVFNAEAAALAGGAVATVPGALIVSCALALGQTGGKLTIFAAVRRGRMLRDGRPQRPARWRWQQRVRDWSSSLLRMLEHRHWAAGIVLLAGSVGIPPLLAVAATAGASRMRWLDFTVCCFLGRWARFAVIAVPIALAH